MRLPTLSENASYRAGIASRTLAAVLGGYLATSAAASLLALALPAMGASRADAVINSTLLSFALLTCAVLWAFAARSAARAWLGLLLPSAVMGGIAYALYRSLP
ncbi:DUF3649 domain-containing protein [Pseudoduganella violacea]|uniref:4-amino-4-deoxy-L-arabinose transferase-like glycosyltransferase n=1 Tax=Pseudoduganella violacea TaxID=1715466 RepID=A0A7W5FSU1_9BURK|nr:DUF3649 domain-containing protein [Pseudoduganella violacea]MBB3117937.1 4-amino-4-deoxy-L-arabinose transferase-like glycosyltransferase [Pseudoduganella violacea]